MSIVIDSLAEDATLFDIAEKVREIKSTNESIRLSLIEILTSNNVEVGTASTLQELVALVEELFAEEDYPLPECFKTEPDNPFGTSLYCKIRYRDKDGLDRVMYSKSSSSGYPCFNEKTNILYFGTKATYVQGYVYKNNAWSTISEAYYGYLPSGAELESVYSNSLDIPYHSNSSYYGKTWKTKNDI